MYLDISIRFGYSGFNTIFNLNLFFQVETYKSSNMSYRYIYLLNMSFACTRINLLTAINT